MRPRRAVKGARSRKLGAWLLLGAAVLCAGSAAALYRSRTSLLSLAHGLTAPAEHMVKVTKATQIAMALLAPAAKRSTRKVLPAHDHGHEHGRAAPSGQPAASIRPAASGQPAAADAARRR